MNNAQQQAYAQAYQQYQAQAMQYAQAQQGQTAAAAGVPGQQVNQKYKSTLCNIWLMEGVCARGRMCHYAHGIRELNYSQYYSQFWPQATGASPNAGIAKPEEYQSRFYKTAMCQFWQQRGTCNNGDNCRWAHGEHEMRRPQDQNGQHVGQQQQFDGVGGELIGPQLPPSATEQPEGGGSSIAAGTGNNNNEEGAMTENGGGGEGGRKRNWQEAGLDDGGAEGGGGDGQAKGEGTA